MKRVSFISVIILVILNSCTQRSPEQIETFNNKMKNIQTYAVEVGSLAQTSYESDYIEDLVYFGSFILEQADSTIYSTIDAKKIAVENGWENEEAITTQIEIYAQSVYENADKSYKSLGIEEKKKYLEKLIQDIKLLNEEISSGIIKTR